MTHNPMTHMSRRQRQIMDILFRHRKATAEEIRERLPDPPSNSAVRALLATMVNKGYVTQKEENFRYVYSAAIQQEVAQKSAIDRLVNTFFGGSTAATVNALLGLKSEQISLEELNELSEIIEKAKKK